jgi:hypothetical protein
MMGVKPPGHHTLSIPSERKGYYKRKVSCWYLLGLLSYSVRITGIRR